MAISPEHRVSPAGQVPARGNVPGVSYLAQASERSVQMAAAIARGVAEALQMEPAPAANLSTIAVEACRNVVQHAYDPGSPGPIWIRMAPGTLPTGGPSVNISIRDAGSGCSVWPTGADPPGVGLSLSCTLSESLAITSSRRAGTSIEAAVSVAGGDPSEEEPDVAARAPAAGTCELSFDEPGLLASVLPRAAVAQVGGAEAPMDRLADVSLIADAIAADLVGAAETSLPLIRIREPAPGTFTEIAVGPLARTRAEVMRASLGAVTAELPSAAAVTVESAEPGALCRVAVLDGRWPATREN